MGIGIVVLAYLGLAALLLAVSIPLSRFVSARMSVEVRRGRSIVRMIPFALAAAPLTLFTVALVWANVAPPPVLFAEVFGVPPFPGIRELQGRSAATNDAREIFLSFRAKPGAVPAIAGAQREDVGRGEADWVPMPGEGAPPWWRAPACADRQVHVVRGHAQWDEVVVTECRSDDHVYVQARWID